MTASTIFAAQYRAFSCGPWVAGSGRADKAAGPITRLAGRSPEARQRGDPEMVTKESAYAATSPRSFNQTAHEDRGGTRKSAASQTESRKRRVSTRSRASRFGIAT